MPTFRSTRVVLREEVRPATVRYEEGRFVSIGHGAADHDFGDLVVLPGLVDSHVHVNEPGRTDWEGFESATRAAVAGGTTTIVDMPLNSVPPTTTVEALRQKKQAAYGKLAADCAFWGGIVPGSEDEIEELTRAGVCGFKAFLVDSGVPEFPPVSVSDLDELELDVPLLVHAESEDLLTLSGSDYPGYLASRPAEAEAEAIDEVGRLRTAVHVLHVSSAPGVDAVARNDRVSAETCPHYLTFTDADVTGPEFKCAPPIRTAEDREALWEGLESEVISMVVSDHSPAPPELKQGGFDTAWGGIASIQLRLVATWTGASDRGIGLVTLARWLAHAPAVLAGLDDRKGSIAVGRDADFVLFDPDGETVVNAANLLQRHPLSPYEGMRLRGRVVDTVVGAPARMLRRK